MDEEPDYGTPRLRLWRNGVQAGLTQGSSPAKGVSGRCGRAAEAH